MKNPYEYMADWELYEIYDDYVKSSKEHKRCESFVPYAKEIKENIGGDFTLREAIEETKIDFLNEVARRYFVDFLV